MLKFPRKIRKYSEKFLSDVSPLAIAKYVQEKEVNISWRAACAIAGAEIASVYRDFKDLGEFKTQIDDLSS